MGIWAHRQALAVREAGAEVRVIVLHRIVPPRSALADGVRQAASTLKQMMAEPRHQVRDGVEVTYAPYVSPPRERGYPDWGAWAAPSLALALRQLRRSFPYELIHAHNAVPAGDAVRRASPRTPLIVSEHGADVLYTAWLGPRGARAVARGLGAAQLVLANSRGIAELARARGAARTQVVHLGAELPAKGSRGAQLHTTARAVRPRPGPPTLVTVAHLVARKRHADVLRALAVLGPRHPTLRYSIVGDGPRATRAGSAGRRLGVAERVDFHGQLDPAARTRAGAKRDRVRDALHGGGLRHRLHRGDGRRGARDRLPRRAGPGGDRGGRRGLPAGAARRHRATQPAHRRAALRRSAAARGLRTGAGDGQRGLHLGALRRADARRLPGGAGARPLRGRRRSRERPRRPRGCGRGCRPRPACRLRLGYGQRPRPRRRRPSRSCSSPATSRPTAWAPSRACTSARAWRSRCSAGGAATAAPIQPGELPFPARDVGPARALRAGRRRGLPGGRVPHRGTRGPVGELGRSPCRAHPPDPVGLAVGPPADAGPRAQLPAAAASVRIRAGGRHLRAPRERVRATTRRRQRVRGAPGRGQRVLVRPRRRRAAAAELAAGGADALRVRRATGAREKGLAVLLDAWAQAGPPPTSALVLVGARTGQPQGEGTNARARRSTRSASSRRSDCARSTRTRTCWSCRRSPRRASASRGGWWSTRR